MHILSIVASNNTLPALVQVEKGMGKVFSAGLPIQPEIYSEYLDLYRFPDPARLDRIADGITTKYSDVPMDVIMATGIGALTFALKYRDLIAPGVPVVFGGMGADALKGLILPDDVSGVISPLDVKGTVDLARRLQPGATGIVVVSGSAPFDKAWEASARATLGDIYAGLAVSYLTDLSVDGFAAAAANLDPDTILVILSVYVDAAGHRLVPVEAARTIAAAATAPSYTVYDTFIGAGLVGGVVEPFESLGEAMARQALQAMANGANTPQTTVAESRTIVDWRQLRRWHMNPKNVPAGSDVWFHDPTIWEQYKLQISGAALIILLQAATIAALIVQGRHRRRTDAQLSQERRKLFHLSRTTQLGELSGALAHELNQPLTSILANAEAGSKLLERNPPDLKEVADVLSDIASEDRRAADIILQLRRLFVKGEAALARVDLNQVVAATVTLLARELVARQTSVEVRRDVDSLPVMGDFAQLQQVVLNLLLNAADAMADQPAGDRRVIVQTSIGPKGERHLSVTDNGHGVTADMRENAFKPFVTTKPSGLGFGLSICRSIAEAHGGTLAFDSSVTGGARIILTLPAV